MRGSVKIRKPGANSSERSSGTHWAPDEMHIDIRETRSQCVPEGLYQKALDATSLALGSGHYLGTGGGRVLQGVGTAQAKIVLNTWYRE